MRLERKIELNASAERIFGVISDGMNTPRWNLTVDEVSEEEPGRYLLKTKIGDVIIVGSDSVENQSITWQMEESQINSMGYIIKPKADISEVTIWVDFDKKKLSKGFGKAGELLLESLRNYINFLEDGGDPEKFDKKAITVSP
ncbi:MAG: SRPBCC family protein [Candidatus Hermodarchaeota archaeon]